MHTSLTDKEFSIRPYHPTDLPALYHICLKTGHNGEDASSLFSDPELLGHYYAGPYAVAEPHLAIVLTRHYRPVGYALGARDSAAFGRWCEDSWFPPLRERYPLPVTPSQSDAERSVIEAIHRGRAQKNLWPAFPAHLHIDILPEGQGQGFGRRLMERLWERLIDLAVPGVHLGVGIDNTRAIAFYRHIGFEEIEAHPWGYILGKEF